MERLLKTVDFDPNSRPISVLNGLESVYGYFGKEHSNIGDYLVDRIKTHKRSDKIRTVVVIGAPGVSKTTFLSELAEKLDGKLLAVFFDNAFATAERIHGPRVQIQAEGRLAEFWQTVNNEIYKDYKKIADATKKKAFKDYMRSAELVCIGSAEQDRGDSFLKKLIPTRNHAKGVFVVAIAPEEAKEGRITTQIQASFIRGVVAKSKHPEETVDNLLAAGVEIKNIDPAWEKREIGQQLQMFVTRMATENQIIALNREIEESVSQMNNNDLFHIRSLIPEKFHESPHVLHLMDKIKLRIRIPENNYMVVFNPYNRNLRPRIDLGFHKQALKIH